MELQILHQVRHQTQSQAETAEAVAAMEAAVTAVVAAVMHHHQDLEVEAEVAQEAEVVHQDLQQRQQR